jgi:hypothetical protein
MNFDPIRSRLAAWSIFGLVAASLVAITPAANAVGGSGPISPTEFSFSRASTDGSSYIVKPNETAGLQSTTSVDENWTVWPLPRNTVLSRTALKVTTLPADVEQYEWDYRNWQIADWQVDDCLYYEDSTTLKLTSAMTCARSLWVSDTITVQNNSASNKTVVTNAGALRVKYGKKTIGASLAVTNTAVANVTTRDIESVAITNAEDYVTLTFSVCLAEEFLTADEQLTVHPIVTRNGSDTAFTINDWEDQLLNEMSPEAGVKYVVPTPEEGADLENVIVSVNLSVDETVAGTYTGSVDVKKNGTSVTEPCPTDEAGWPTLTEIDGVSGSAEATITSRSVPSDTYTANDNFDQYSSQDDGFGGMFYWGYPGESWEDNANSDVNIVHMNGDTPNNSLAGAGEIDVSLGSTPYLEIARFGQNGQSWYTLVEGNRGSYELTTGSMTTAGTQTSTFASRALNGLCGRGFISQGLGAISAATVNPILHVYCASGSISKAVVAKVVGGRASVVTTLGTGTRSRPCVVPSVGTDTRAAGNQAAVVFYTRVSSRDSEGMCGGWGATVSSRSITTVTADLAATQNRITSNPWTGRDEPAFLQIAAGSSPGTWFGVSNEMIDVGYSPHIPAQLFSMTGTAITIRSNEITLDDSTDFGEWSLVSPLSQVTSNEWTLTISGTASVDSENVDRATVATINPNTGVITNGDILEMTDMGYVSGRIIGSFSTDSNGNATMYAVTGTGTYKSTVWSLIG